MEKDKWLSDKFQKLTHENRERGPDVDLLRVLEMLCWVALGVMLLPIILLAALMYTLMHEKGGSTN